MLIGSAPFSLANDPVYSVLSLFRMLFSARTVAYMDNTHFEILAGAFTIWVLLFPPL